MMMGSAGGRPGGFGTGSGMVSLRVPWTVWTDDRDRAASPAACPAGFSSISACMRMASIAAGVSLAHIGDRGFGVRRLDLKRRDERVLGFNRHDLDPVADLDPDRHTVRSWLSLRDPTESWLGTWASAVLEPDRMADLSPPTEFVSASALGQGTAYGAAGRGSCFAGSDRPRRRAVRSGRAWAGGSGALSFRCGRGCRACPARDGPAADAAAAGATRCGRAACVAQTIFTT